MATETRRKVVVADDDASVRAVIAEYLSACGCEVIEAANGLEALLQVKRSAPQVVVLDVQMPRLGGLEAIPRIRAFDASIGIVVITGDADARLHEQARKRGASAVLAKPIGLPELAAAVAAPERPLRSTRAEAPTPTFASAPATAAALRTPTPAPSSVATPTAAPSASRPSGGIMIVDDEPSVSDVLHDLLSLQGYHVWTVADAASALREVVASAPDIVLLDIKMPGLNGLDALPAFRALAPRTVVIMVSGTTDSEIAKRALAHGAFDYVTKPVDITYLAQTIETAFRFRALDL